MSQSSPSGKRQSSRQLRERKQKKLYSEDWALGDEEIEGKRTFNLQDKLEDPLFASHNIVKEMHGTELNIAYFQRYGFNTPLVFKEKTGLGLRVPTSNFSINDVRMCVGSRRVLDVMDVNTQKNSEMTMKEWQKYYEDPSKNKLLNVISLEFSHTKLENYVQSPTVVRQVDWVDNVWPRHLKESQIEATNLLDDMKYPKVQKYCLMSVKGCFTDFHVDFGGTSVWYHILKGCKVFWLIPPTENNLDLYERWVLSGKQSDIFFGDTVDKCARIILYEGNTFFIPTGWIHAVYTPLDSLVFGGNFLHSYGIEKQLKIAQVEDNTKVPQKFRYPFFTEMLWYVLERYVFCLLGNSHLSGGHDINIPADRPHVHLTQVELHGLKEIVLYLHMLPPHKKNVPDLIKDPILLIQDVRTLICQHRLDNRELAISCRSALAVPEGSEPRLKIATPSRSPFMKTANAIRMGTSVRTPPQVPMPVYNRHVLNKTPPVTSTPLSCGGSSNSSSVSPDKGGPRRRRTRCKKCEACQRSDCGDCSFCLDMVKFGGPGRAKQTCNMRQCLQPMLPVTAACTNCGLDGWMQTPVTPLQKGPQRFGSASNLMECSVCYEIAHPICIQRICPDFTGYINEDMPNSWECPICCKLGKNTDYRPRHFRARQKSTDIRRMSINSELHDLSNSGSDDEIKVQPIKKRRSSEDENRIDSNRKTALAQQIASNSSKQLKKPMVVVRPSVIQNTTTLANLALDKRVLVAVFKWLLPCDLLKCALVCKTWATFSIEPAIWRKMVFVRRHISSDMLKGIVRRQPEQLQLDWCHINKFQLPWLIQRLNNLRKLSLVSVNIKTSISLKSNHSATLHSLDLSFISDFYDAALRDILGPNNDIRSGLAVESIRFRNLKELKLAGTDISDIAMRYVTQYLPSMQHLSLSLCPRITDAGIAQLTTKPANTIVNLISLDLSHTKLVTEISLDHLSKCERLIRLDCRHALMISTQALIKFAAKSERDLQVRDIKLVDLRKG